MDKTASVKREDGFAVIRIPMSEVHGLRVALAECPCRATKSTETANIRRRFDKALARLETR
ncbi:hypothetical protein [Paracoccus alkanivorans]|uniref:Uncharacterized protein n=1 Tax=Paracoccus alkanivorans TaxID=2116655 RepID=A0A3M0M926_9RHOB|nr:hypothetical protein [Paracoccus alkanivorans]RMC33743.1 hypothetical protein C9E81_15685 [Paracoccus alkanivorans]